MYDLTAYGDMIADRGRTSAYARALERFITPTSVVLDIGTGPGIMALLACRAGAARVYAVEADPVIHLAREVAAANGLTDRIRFVQAMTTEIDLPERVDGIVADIHGSLPLFGRSLPSILDARARFLKPGGWIVPARETLWAALVSAANAHGRLLGAWTTEYGFDLAGARFRAANQGGRQRMAAADLIVEPQCWTVLDYVTRDSVHASGRLTWTMASAAVGHGASVWFDAETAPGIGFSNSPASGERHVFAQEFFPWPEPVSLAVGDEVQLSIRADLVGEDYVWCWDTVVIDAGSGLVKTTLRQSSWLAASLSSEDLRKSAHTFVPDLNEEARIDRRVLDLMASHLSLGEIATTILEAYPASFKNWDAALTRAARLSNRYSR